MTLGMVSSMAHNPDNFGITYLHKLNIYNSGDVEFYDCVGSKFSTVPWDIRLHVTTKNNSWFTCKIAKDLFLVFSPVPIDCWLQVFPGMCIEGCRGYVGNL